MTCASTLLLPGASDRLQHAYSKYPSHYDDVFDEVHDRLVANGSATKLDLAALIAWKHVRNAKWMSQLLRQPDELVRQVTSKAMSAHLTDGDRIAALRTLPGFGSGGAFTSVFLSAWDQSHFGVYDRLVLGRRTLVVTNACTCDWSELTTYWEHLRAISKEMRTRHAPDGSSWTPRRVEMAIMNLVDAE